MEDEIRHDPDSMCRLHLISTANQILNSFGALSTRERISISNKELLEKQFDPEVEGIWTENEFSTVFWRFEGIANGYHLYRYQADISRKSNARDDYDFTISLAAITSDHLYISKDETTFYKIPKSLNGLLEEVGFSSNAGVMSFKDTADGEPATYIAFDDFNLYYDISTKELMAERQIEVVDSISV
ncbi:MAG: hypothetical protein J6I52_11440 [Prevotella sp.]|nr:hypothetical protein [Prevotella sp.]